MRAMTSKVKTPLDQLTALITTLFILFFYFLK